MLEMLLHTPEEMSSDNEYVLKQTLPTQTIGWTVPDDVTSICVVCVGHGAAGGGGLSYRNNIAVVPGELLTLAFSISTSDTYNGGSTRLLRGSTVLCIAYAGGWVTSTNASVYGGYGGKNANTINDGGGNGGAGNVPPPGYIGGGAGGYSGVGGRSGRSSTENTMGLAGSGSGSGARGITGERMLGGNVGLYGIGITGANTSSSGGHGNDGSPGKVVCGGGACSITSRFNGGIRIIWGAGYYYPNYALNPDPTIVPVMTSNTAPVGYVASASSFLNSQASPYFAFSDRSDPWAASTLSASGNVNEWIMIKLPTMEKVKRYSMRNFGTWGIIDYQFQGSVDGVDFTTLHSRTGITASEDNALKEHTIDNDQDYLYYRILITKIKPDSYASLTRLNLYRS